MALQPGAHEPGRRVALLILGIGAGGVALALGYRLFDFGPQFLGFDLTHILTAGIIYVIVGGALLLTMRAGAHAPRPAARPTRLPQATPAVPDDRPIPDAAPASAPPAAVRSVPAARGASMLAPLDDLTALTGITPQTQEALYEAGFRTYAHLAAADAASLRQALTAAGERDQNDYIESWPRQARCLVEGDASGLAAYQAQLHARQAAAGHSAQPQDESS